MCEALTLDQFARYVGQEFITHLPTGDIRVTLIETKSLGAAGCTKTGREPFSIIFRGPSVSLLSQAIYRLEHEEIGYRDIFLVPLGPDSEGMRYEAIFT